MEIQFHAGSVPEPLIVVSGKPQPWFSALEHSVLPQKWHTLRSDDLRKADTLLRETGPCIGVVDLSQDEFSLSGIIALVSNHKRVRWIAFIRESQLSSDTVCRFIVNFCVDFFTAPVQAKQLINIIGHQSDMLQLEKRVWPTSDDDKNMGLIGESVAIKRLREQIKRVAATDVSILIYGENGSGKESVAKAIHAVSSRSKAPFITVNCGALSEVRMQKEVFGVSAADGSVSYLEKANGGTLFLNNILAMSAPQQSNLLRFMQHNKIETGNGSKELDVRILAAYNSDIEKALADKDFNEELYHHINVLRIDVPCLKERPGDIVILAKLFLQKFSKDYHAQADDFSDGAIKSMVQYHWPGNVRELMNQVKRAVLMSNSTTIDLPQLNLPHTKGKRTLKSIKDNAEREALLMALESHNGQASLAAKELEVSRATMYRLLNKHNLLNRVE